MIDPNEPIHPTYAITEGLQDKLDRPGLTKREWFAAMAMQGLFANTNVTQGGNTPKQCAFMASVAADALIAELNRQQTEGDSNESRA